MKSLKQRKYETYAAYLWWISIAISLTFRYLPQNGVFVKHSEKTASPVTLFFLDLLMAGFGYLVWNGYRWAKVLMLVMLVYGMAASFYHYSKGEDFILLNTPSGIYTVVQWLLSIAIMTLLIFSFLITMIKVGKEV